MAWVSVHIETRGDDPIGMTGDEFGERLDDLVNALMPHHGVVTGGGSRPSWGATISVESPTALTPIADASSPTGRSSAPKPSARMSSTKTWPGSQLYNARARKVV